MSDNKEEKIEGAIEEKPVAPKRKPPVKKQLTRTQSFSETDKVKLERVKRTKVVRVQDIITNPVPIAGKKEA